MRLQDLNWMDVERYLETDSRVILPVGATQQNAYLSLMTATLIPARIADALAQRENILVAPPLNFGVSRHYSEYPGTISLSRSTFDYAVMEIVESLLHQGFRRFFVVNGHSGNHLPDRLADFQMEGVIRVRWYDWWRGPAAGDFARAQGLRIDHGNWCQNFPFTRVSDVPDGVKEEVNMSYVDAGFGVREVLGDGSFGGPYAIDEDDMQTFFQRVVEEAAVQLRDMGHD